MYTIHALPNTNTRKGMGGHCLTYHTKSWGRLHFPLQGVAVNNVRAKEKKDLR